MLKNHNSEMPNNNEEYHSILKKRKSIPNSPFKTVRFSTDANDVQFI